MGGLQNLEEQNFSEPSSYTYELSICTIFRDEARYLDEWIKFHLGVGVQHFYLCSHNSEDEYLKVLQPYIDRGLVDLTELKDNPNNGSDSFINSTQCVYYSESIERLKGISKWVAIIDSDEFLFPSKGHGTLLDVLKEFENNSYGAVAVNWQMFGTSKIPKLPKKSFITRHLTRCAVKDYSTNLHVKSIVRPERVSKVDNPHYAIFYPGYVQVNTDHVNFEGPFSPYVQVDTLRINHYWTRDEYYYNKVKIPRQKLWWGHDKKYLRKICKEMNETTDYSILPFLNGLSYK